MIPHDRLLIRTAQSYSILAAETGRILEHKRYDPAHFAVVSKHVEHAGHTVVLINKDELSTSRVITQEHPHAMLPPLDIMITEDKGSLRRLTLLEGSSEPVTLWSLPAQREPLAKTSAVDVGHL